MLLVLGVMRCLFPLHLVSYSNMDGAFCTDLTMTAPSDLFTEAAGSLAASNSLHSNSSTEGTLALDSSGVIVAIQGFYA